METNLISSRSAEGGRRRFFIAVAVFAAVVLAYALAFQGSRGLWEPDEGRYTAVAVQMLQSGNFLYPALNPETPHYTKPPLTYWAIAGGMELLGKNEWGARLANAIAFAATIFFVWLLARKIFPTQSYWPPLIYALSPFPVIAANIITTDTLLCLWETVAAYGFVSWWLERNGSKQFRHLALMWLGFALAFLTKGFPGLLPLVAMIVFVALADGKKAARHLFHPGGMTLFLAVGLSWFIAVVAARPQLIHYFLYNEFFQRVFSGSFNRNPEWYGAFKIYLPVLLAGALPWAPALAPTILPAGKKIFSRAWWREKLQNDPLTAFLLFWIFLPLAVFCVSRSRMYLYPLPLFVPIALLLGKMLATHPGFLRLKPAFVAAMMLALLLAGKFALSKIHNRKDDRAFAQAIAAKISPAPNEIVFLDTAPRWGLRLYLPGEVEQATLKPAPDIQPQPQTLAQKMAAQKNSSLLVFDKKETPAVISELKRLNCPAQTLFEFDGFEFAAPGGDLKSSGR